MSPYWPYGSGAEVAEVNTKRKYRKYEGLIPFAQCSHTAWQWCGIWAEKKIMHRHHAKHQYFLCAQFLLSPLPATTQCIWNHTFSLTKTHIREPSSLQWSMFHVNAHKYPLILNLVSNCLKKVTKKFHAEIPKSTKNYFNWCTVLQTTWPGKKASNSFQSVNSACSNTLIRKNVSQQYLIDPKKRYSWFSFWATYLPPPRKRSPVAMEWAMWDPYMAPPYCCPTRFRRNRQMRNTSRSPVPDITWTEWCRRKVTVWPKVLTKVEEGKEMSFLCYHFDFNCDTKICRVVLCNTLDHREEI